MRRSLRHFLLCMFVCPAVPASQTAPELLGFEDLVVLADTQWPKGELAERCRKLLSTPLLSNQAYYRGAKPRRPVREGLGPVLRAAMWNIERGAEFDLVRLAFTDPDRLLDEVNKRSVRDPAALEAVRRQAGLLRDSDVIILNEVDLGMTRTDYRFVARELAEAMEMNYAFGVEFIEVDKINLGLEELVAPDEASREALKKAMAVDLPFEEPGTT